MDLSQYLWGCKWKLSTVKHIMVLMVTLFKDCINWLLFVPFRVLSYKPVTLWMTNFWVVLASLMPTPVHKLQVSKSKNFYTAALLASPAITLQVGCLLVSHFCPSTLPYLLYCSAFIQATISAEGSPVWAWAQGLFPLNVFFFFPYLATVAYSGSGSCIL